MVFEEKAIVKIGRRKETKPCHLTALAGDTIVSIPNRDEYLPTELSPTQTHNFTTAASIVDKSPDPSTQPTKKKAQRRKIKKQLTLRGDIEIARLAIALDVSKFLRIWLVAHEMIRTAQSQGKPVNYVLTDMLFTNLKTYGINYTRANYRQLLRVGGSRFWREHEGRLYVTGRIRLAEILVKLALERNLPELVANDRPGGRDWYIPVNGTLMDFHAHDYPTISRQTLKTIWNRSRQQLQIWEQRANIATTENYAQSSYTGDERIPSHAVSGLRRYKTQPVEVVWRWQRPNTYHAPKYLREHGHKGQARKVRKAVNEICNAHQHPEKMAGAHPLGIRNFSTLKAYRDVWRHDSRNDRPNTQADYVLLGKESIQKRGRPIRVWELMDKITREPQTAAGDYEPMVPYQRVRYGDV